jgi:hypothetical protein
LTSDASASTREAVNHTAAARKTKRPLKRHIVSGACDRSMSARKLQRAYSSASDFGAN